MTSTTPTPPTQAQSKGEVLKPSAASPKTLYKTPSAFEQKFGYYRGVRHGAHIFISGTTAVAVNPTTAVSASAPPQIQYPGDARAQTRVAFEECIRAVEALGGERGGVVRVRMFVSRPEDCGGVGEMMREMFGRKEGDDGNIDAGVGVAATMLVVRDGFVDPDMLVEVEVDAMVES